MLIGKHFAIVWTNIVFCAFDDVLSGSLLSN